MKDKVTVALVQAAAAYLNLAESIDRAEKLIVEAATGGASLVVFGETWLSGYPAWLDICPEAAYWNHEPVKEVFARMHRSSITVPGPETTRLGKLAAKYKLCLVIGINERVEQGPGNGTIYNSLLTFGEDGHLKNHHRKLMPTYTERMVYGHGDGQGLQAIDTSFGRVGGLICWEHWMPLARQAMHQSGEAIHVAVWPTVHEKHQLASRHYAFEGRCHVLAVGQLLQARDLPTELKLPEHLNSSDYVLRGGSCIIGPDGEYLLEPVFEEERLLLTELDLSRNTKERMNLDVSGHYSRPDVFGFSVRKERP